MPDYPEPFGRYTLLSEIGHGGFATVYHAHDEEEDRDVALKILAPRLGGDPLFVQRFDQEFTTAASFNHPHLVRVYDHGEINARRYIAMQLVRGPNLRERLRGTGALVPALALQYASQIGEALDALHARQVIHGDVKAANILLDQDGTALLGDLGLQRAGEATTSMTATSRDFGGTAEYLSPEQAEGHPATERSDLYSFAVVIYEMLTGRVPFQAAAPAVLAQMHADTPPPSPLEFQKDLPPALAIEVLHGMAKQPQDRPATAAALVQALQAALDPAQQAAAQQILAILNAREKRVVEARARVEQQRRRTAEDERARRLADDRAAQLESEAATIEVVVKEMNATLDTAKRAAEKAENDRRKADAEAQAARDRLAQVQKSLGIDPEKQAEVRPSAPQNALALTLAPGVTLDWVRIPAGEFLMGSTDASSDEKPQHKVMLDEYLIGKYAVTNEQFAAFVKATGYVTTAEKAGSGYTYTGGNWEDVKGAQWQHPKGPGSDLNGKERHPVALVSWDDAVAFCAWAQQTSGRQVQLPTEAQWEKAARGTDGRIYPWGNEAPNANLLNFDMKVKDTTAVGKYSPAGDSPYGLADMAGNVWEWTSSLHKGYPYQANDGREDQSSRAARVLRGGAFHGVASYVRCAYRNYFNPNSRSADYGFRVVVSAIS